MKYIDLINESIQKMADKPSEGAIIAAQSIAKEIDDALANGYEIKWEFLHIQNSDTIDVVNATNKPSFVCRIYDTNMKNEVLEILEGVDMEKMGANQYCRIVTICADIRG